MFKPLNFESGVLEGEMNEQARRHNLGVQEEIRFGISKFAMDMADEFENYTHAVDQAEKYRDARRDMDRKIDIQFQRYMSEGLDKYLTSVSRDHALKYQIEERSIRNDTAFEEVQRKEKALHEEKICLDKEKAEAEAERPANCRTTEVHFLSPTISLVGMDKDLPFTNLLQEEGLTNYEFMEYAQGDESTTQVPSTQPLSSSSTKTKRGENFCEKEDEILVSAWLNTSLDSIHGNDQKNDTFWRRIHAYFLTSNTFNRTHDSLRNRWGTIQREVVRFTGIYEQIVGTYMSGSGYIDQEKLDKAKSLYLELHMCSFQYEHCWKLLKDQEKWKSVAQKPSSKRRPTTGSSALDSIDLEEDTAGHTFVESERPFGTKAANARVKKAMNGEASSSTVDDLVKEVRDLKELKIRSSMKQEYWSEQACRVQQERLMFEREKEDNFIMMMDPTHMGEMQLKYITRKQKEIIQRKRTEDFENFFSS